MDFLRQPVARDTTPNSANEIGRRLAHVALIGSGLALPVLAVVALAGRDEGVVRALWITAAIFAALLIARRFGKAAGKTPLAASPALVATPAPSAPASASRAPSAGLPRVLVLNAALGGDAGNTARALALLAGHLAGRAEVERAALAGPAARDFAALAPALRSADAIVIGTGVHWDSWSSALQKFLEDATPAEATALWVGKPAAVVVTEHSVGGKAVLSRLQGVLATLGCELPLFSGVVLSQAAQLARAGHPSGGAADDLWSPEDLAVVAHNLAHAAARRSAAWRAWPVDRRDYAAVWWRE